MPRLLLLVLALLLAACGAAPEGAPVNTRAARLTPIHPYYSGAGEIPASPREIAAGRVLVAEWGQSNAESATSLPAADPAWRPPGNPGRVWYWVSDGTNYASGAGTAGPVGTVGNDWVPFDNYRLGTTTRFLPAAAFVRGLLERGIPAAAVVVAQGSTSISSDHYWHAPDGPLLQIFEHEVRTALATGYFTEIVFYSSIGEADAARADTAGAYYVNYRAIQDTLRKDFGDYPQRYVISKLHPDCVAPYTIVVRDAQQRLAEQQDTVALETSWGHLNADGLHWAVEQNASISLDGAAAVTDTPLIPWVGGLGQDAYFDGGAGTGPAGGTTLDVSVTARGYGAPETLLFGSVGAGTIGYQLVRTATGIRGTVTDASGQVRVVAGATGPAGVFGLHLAAGVLSLTADGTEVATTGVVGYRPATSGRPRIGRGAGAEIARVEVTDPSGAYTWTAQDAGGEWWSRGPGPHVQLTKVGGAHLVF